MADHRAQRRGGRRDESVPADRPGRAGGAALLAAVIVLDQFSRHLFRNSPQAYAADPLARRLARDAIARGDDRTMTNQERLGRFPHRNDVLGRISTEDEIALLQDPTGSF